MSEEIHFTSGHYAGGSVKLEKPVPLPDGTLVGVAIIRDAFRDDWSRLATEGLASAYGDDEPDYSDAMLLPANNDKPKAE